MFSAGSRYASLFWPAPTRAACRRMRIVAAGLARSFQITNLFAGAQRARESAPRGAGATRVAFNGWTMRRRNRAGDASGLRELMRFLGLCRHRACRRGRAVVRRPATARHGPRARGAPRVLLLDEPLAGLAAAERERVAHADQAHRRRSAGAAGRTRHRSRVRAGRSRDGDERWQGAARWHRCRRARQRSRARGLHRLRHRRACRHGAR